MDTCVKWKQLHKIICDLDLQKPGTIPHFQKLRFLYHGVLDAKAFFCSNITLAILVDFKIYGYVVREVMYPFVWIPTVIKVTRF